LIKKFHEGLKPKYLQITRMEYKKSILQGRKPEMTYITWDKTLLTHNNNNKQKSKINKINKIKTKVK